MSEIITRKKQAVALITAVMLLAVLILSLAFVVSHGEHDCTGEGCPICAEIEATLAVVRLAADGIIVGTAGLVLYRYLSDKNVSSYHSRFSCPVSLIRLKIRLNN